MGKKRLRRIFSPDEIATLHFAYFMGKDATICLNMNWSNWRSTQYQTAVKYTWILCRKKIQWAGNWAITGLELIYFSYFLFYGTFTTQYNLIDGTLKHKWQCIDWMWQRTVKKSLDVHKRVFSMSDISFMGHLVHASVASEQMGYFTFILKVAMAQIALLYVYEWKEQFLMDQ